MPKNPSNFGKYFQKMDSINSIGNLNSFRRPRNSISNDRLGDQSSLFESKNQWGLPMPKQNSINSLFSFQSNRFQTHGMADRNNPIPQSNHQNFAVPAEVYDPLRPNTSTATLRSLHDEALGPESAHDLDPPPVKDAVMVTVEFVDENAGSEQEEPHDDDGSNDNVHNMVANEPTRTNSVLSLANSEVIMKLHSMQGLDHDSSAAEKLGQRPIKKVKKQYQKTKDNNNEVAERKIWAKIATLEQRFAEVQYSNGKMFVPEPQVKRGRVPELDGIQKGIKNMKKRFSLYLQMPNNTAQERKIRLKKRNAISAAQTRVVVKIQDLEQ